MIANIADFGPIGLFLIFGVFVAVLAVLNAPRRK
jgi:hypothetical protein